MSGVYTETLNRLIEEFEKLPGIGPKPASSAVPAKAETELVDGLLQRLIGKMDSRSFNFAQDRQAQWNQELGIIGLGTCYFEELSFQAAAFGKFPGCDGHI